MTGAVCGPACPASPPGGVAAGDLSAFESVSHPSAFSPLGVKVPPRVPGGYNRHRRLHQSFHLTHGLRLRRSAWRAARMARSLPGGLPSAPAAGVRVRLGSAPSGATGGGHTSHWQWMRRSRERFSHQNWGQSASCRKWAVCITMTNE
jgi:hypothetical protein